MAPVRDERDRTERTRRGELAAEVEKARASEAQVAAAAARVAHAEAALAKASALAGETALVLERIERFTQRRRRELAIAREEHARAIASHAGQLAEADAARGRLVRARADREIIERHFARWRTERAKLAERRAD